MGIAALVVRVALTWRSTGGPAGNYGYDAAVYFAAGDALVHGRLPYADFTLVHPPAIALALAPVAALGRAVGDHRAFEIGNALFELLGAANAALIVLIARRRGLGLSAAACGGLFYVVWLGAAQSDSSARLEPLGTFAFLLACLLLPTATSSVGRWRGLGCGFALGLAVSTKIWWSLPVLVLLLVVVQRPVSRRAVGPILGGLALAGLLLDAPFFLTSPTAMFHQVVTDQLSRPASGFTRPRRLDDLTGFFEVFPTTVGPRVLAVVSVACLLVLAACVGAWRQKAMRPWVTVLVVQLLVLMAAPTYFYFYAAYLAGPAALVLAGAAEHRSRLLAAAPRVAVTASAVLTVTGLVIGRPDISAPVPGAATLATAVRHVHCLVSDSPMALIELNALTRDLGRGCPNWVDVSGRSFGVTARRHGAALKRTQDPLWQRDLRSYLFTGDALVYFRASTGVGPVLNHDIRHLPVLAQVDGLVVYDLHRRS